MAAIVSVETIDSLKKARDLISEAPGGLKKCSANCSEVAEETGSEQFKKHLESYDEKLVNFGKISDEFVDVLDKVIDRYSKLSTL